MAKKSERPKKVQKAEPKPRVHRDLDGLRVSIDTFGEIRSNMNIEKINEFLNKNVDDKKLTERGGYDEMKKKAKGKPKKKLGNQ